ncbi:MAG: fatty acid desaturase [Gammaproteobacteria bacterium]|nr:fatty acid desaturase [Gammaproteobacteria bacterium]
MTDPYQNIEAKTLRAVREKIGPIAYQRSRLIIGAWCVLDILFFSLSLLGVILTHQPLLKIFFSLLMGIASSSLFVLAHDAAHGALFRKNWLAELIGTIFMLPALNVYRLWCFGHNRIHHGFTSLSSVDWIWRPLSIEEYQSLSRIKKTMYRVERSLYGCGFHYLAKVWLPKMILFMPGKLAKREKIKLWISKFWVFAYALFMTIIAYHLDGLLGIFTLLVLPFIVFNYVISLIVYLHHTHPEIPFFDAKTEWNHSIGALYCTTVIHSHWLIDCLTHNILTHTPHHVDIRIPFYRLKVAFKSIKMHYSNYLHEYGLNSKVLRHIFRSCKLYDYETHTWHTFKIKGIDSKIMSKKT